MNERGGVTRAGDRAIHARLTVTALFRGGTLVAARYAVREAPPLSVAGWLAVLQRALPGTGLAASRGAGG